MPAAKRPCRELTEDWEQLRLLVTAPAQEAYELLRPIVLFGRTPAERAEEGGWGYSPAFVAVHRGGRPGPERRRHSKDVFTVKTVGAKRMGLKWMGSPVRSRKNLAIPPRNGIPRNPVTRGF